MKRGLPLSGVALFALWLLLNDSLAPGEIILGLVLAFALPLAASWLRPLTANPRRPLVACKLLGRVLFDVVESNLGVARVILGPARGRANSAFMDIPLDLRDPHGLAVLLCIITANPGTVWAGLSDDGATLSLHVLDLQDESLWVATIKHRYESALMEIFE
jgi:multicomponent K+:H+ antiporter subunit E